MDNDQANRDAAELLDEVLALRTPDFHETLMAAVAAKLRKRDEQYADLKAITHDLQNTKARVETKLAQAQAEIERLKDQLKLCHCCRMPHSCECDEY